MNLKFIYLIPILLVVLFSVQNNAEEEAEGGGEAAEAAEEDPPKSCQEFSLGLLTNGLTTALKCLASFKPRSITEYVTRAYCIIKCILKEFGSVDEEGNFDSIGSAFFFDETFPQEVKDVLLPKAQECFSLAEQFNPKDYWCKTYSPFIICIVKTMVSSVLPHILGCFVTPIIGIVLEVLRALAPDPVLQSTVEEMKRMYKQHKRVHCLNHDCTTKYSLTKNKGGPTTMILYHKNMTEIGRGFKTHSGFQFTEMAKNNNVIENAMNHTSINDINNSTTEIIDTFGVNNNGTTIYDYSGNSSNDEAIPFFYINKNQLQKIIDSDESSDSNSVEVSKIISGDGPSKTQKEETPDIINGVHTPKILNIEETPKIVNSEVPSASSAVTSSRIPGNILKVNSESSLNINYEKSHSFNNDQ